MGPNRLHWNLPWLYFIPTTFPLHSAALVSLFQGKVSVSTLLSAQTLCHRQLHAHTPSPASMRSLLTQHLVREAATHHAMKRSSPLSLPLYSTLFFDIVMIYRVKTSDFTLLAIVYLFVGCNRKKCKKNCLR